MTDGDYIIPLITTEHPKFCVQDQNGYIRCLHIDVILDLMKEEEIRNKVDILKKLYSQYQVALELHLNNNGEKINDNASKFD